MFYCIDKNGECRMVTDLKDLNLPGLELETIKNGSNQIIVVGNNAYSVGMYVNSESVNTASDYIQSHWREFINESLVTDKFKNR